eukprot:TRINITY_DN79103_c0_g1_i1.p1 TRINITY_DN79103_c0_g1~~TRINITY_DN79103_c0_g1_i1.p1  ORF type:complete len:265 (+),score=83.72 TRINITY_DN79103_c0_g1_i1:92-886(+)
MAAVVREARAALAAVTAEQGRNLAPAQLPAPPQIPRASSWQRPIAGPGASRRRSGSAGSRVVLEPLHGRTDGTSATVTPVVDAAPEALPPAPTGRPPSGRPSSRGPSRAGRPASGPSSLVLLRPPPSSPSAAPNLNAAPPLHLEVCSESEESKEEVYDEDCAAEAAAVLQELDAFDALLQEQESALQSIACRGSALAQEFAASCTEARQMSSAVAALEEQAQEQEASPPVEEVDEGKSKSQITASEEPRTDDAMQKARRALGLE